MRPATALLGILLLLSSEILTISAKATPVRFNLPAQHADRALLDFSKQAKVDVLFSFDNLHRVRTHAVVGRYEPQRALDLMLRDTGYVARRNGPRTWVITGNSPPAGKVTGRIYAPDGSPARRVRVALTPSRGAVQTDDNGDFVFANVPPGRYELVATAPMVPPIRLNDLLVKPATTLALQTLFFRQSSGPTRLKPFVVEDQSPDSRSLDHSEEPFGPRHAGGNIDLPRTESDPLPYTIFNRTQIAHSGVVNLNEFLQRQLLDSDPSTLPPEQNGDAPSYVVGSTNLNLRGFGDDATVILVDGRRLPEVMTSGSGVQVPDVNFIPIGLVQQIEVLPVSASSIYSGNAVGGVINIVLRPDADENRNEVTATYTNAFGHFDAPESSLSFLHTQTLFGGALRLRVGASFTQVIPATEAELGLHGRSAFAPVPSDQPVYRATPNIRSIAAGADAHPEQPGLFGPGTSPVTSVAPGADGTGGLAAFAGREGLRNDALFKSPGGFAPSEDSIDYPYGRQQRRSDYYGSAVCDLFPWLQLGIDGNYSRTVVSRGYDVMPADLTLPSGSPLNPFHQDVKVSLNETAPELGQNYGEARLEFGSAVLSAIIKGPKKWRMNVDAQYAHNLVKYRGLTGADLNRWQHLVDAGVYNPLRDTQVFGPPREFYDQVLIYRGSRGRFVTLGNYDTLDLGLRITNPAVSLPTGAGTLNTGIDYRRNHLADFNDAQRYGNGAPARDVVHWQGRTLGRYSFFGELQAPMLPERRRPRWLTAADADLALRYVAASSSHESNFAPTLGLKLGFPGGISVRASVSTSNRLPTPVMSRTLVAPSDNGTSAVDRETIFDPVRKSKYPVTVNELVNSDLRPEGAVTQTAGVVFERGKTRRFRAAIDFVDTHKSNEIVFLGAEEIVAGESFWPERVHRNPPAPGEPPGTGFITSVVTSNANLASRHSQDWTASLDYRWNDCLGGALEAYARVLYFQRYRVQTRPDEPATDEINSPDGVYRILKCRANFGASWAGKRISFGMDGHYFHSRRLPISEWSSQGTDHIDPFWQFDGYAQTDIARWLPWKPTRYGLRVQARIDNVLGTSFPRYVNGPSDSGVQPYGDWRGRVYSLSLTATF